MNDRQLVKLAEQIYSIVDGADHKQHRAELTQEIYEWLHEGETITDETAEQLAIQWQEYVNQ